MQVVGETDHLLTRTDLQTSIDETWVGTQTWYQSRSRRGPKVAKGDICLAPDSWARPRGRGNGLRMLQPALKSVHNEFNLADKNMSSQSELVTNIQWRRAAFVLSQPLQLASWPSCSLSSC